MNEHDSEAADDCHRDWVGIVKNCAKLEAAEVVEPPDAVPTVAGAESADAMFNAAAAPSLSAGCVEPASVAAEAPILVAGVAGHSVSGPKESSVAAANGSEHRAALATAASMPVAGAVACGPEQQAIVIMVTMLLAIVITTGMG